MKRIKTFIKDVKNYFVKEDIQRRKTNKIIFLTMLYNFSWGVIKICFGLTISDFFWCISGFFTMDIGICKWIYRVGRLKSKKDEKKEISYYHKMGICLMLGSIMYSSYMARLLIWDIETKSYDTISGITIATFAFIDLGMAIHNLVKSNKLHDLLQSGIRLVGVVSALTAIVLTQIALLSFSDVELFDRNFYNGMVGVGVGCVCFGISVFMMVKASIKQRKLSTISTI